MTVQTLDRTGNSISPLGLERPSAEEDYERQEEAYAGVIPAIAVFSGAIVADIGKIADSMWQGVNKRIASFGINDNDHSFDSLNEIAELLMGARGNFDEDANFTNLSEDKKEALARFVQSTLFDDHPKLSGGKEERLGLAEKLGIKGQGEHTQNEKIRNLEKAIKEEFARRNGVGLN